MAIVWCRAIAVDYLSTLVPIHWWQDKTFVLCTFSLEIVNIVQLADAHELWSESTSNGTWKYYKPGISLVPKPPFTLQEERGFGEYSSTFLYLHEFQQHYLIGWFGNYLTCVGLLDHKPLSCIYSHTLQTYQLSMPPIYWTHFQDLSIATWCEVVLYL